MKKKKFADVMQKTKAKLIKEKTIKEKALAQAQNEIGGKAFFHARKTVERLEKAKLNISKRVEVLQNRQDMRLMGHFNGIELMEKHKLMKEIKLLDKELIKARGEYKKEITKFELPNVKKKIELRVNEILQIRDEKIKFRNNKEQLRQNVVRNHLKYKR